MPPRLPTLTALVALALGSCTSTSPYQGLQPEELFVIATQEYDEGDYENAIEALDRLLLTYGNWPRLPEARLLLGHAYFSQEDYFASRTEYDRFLDRYPGHADAPAAALGACRSLAALSPNPQRDQSFTEEALARCRNVVLDHRAAPEAEEAARIANEMRGKLAQAELERAQFYFRREIWDSAIQYFEFVVDLYPETAAAPQALLGLYRSNLAIGYEDLAQEARERLLSQYPDSEAAAEIRTNGDAG